MDDRLQRTGKASQNGGVGAFCGAFDGREICKTEKKGN